MVKNNDDVNKSKRRIMMIIIIIIIILSLITSCSCAANFWGKIGNLFNNEGTVDINPDDGDKLEIINKDLYFDAKSLIIYLDEKDGKLSFSYKNIAPDKFTCYTSDSSIATCYVDDDYVVVIPKKKGKVVVTVEAEANGKIYKANADVTIEESRKYISLGSTSGTINLTYSKEKLVSFSLVGLTGKINVKVGNENVASASIVGGHIKITGKKVGSTTITIYIIVDDVTYEATYNLKVVKNSSTNVGGNTGSGNNPGGNTGGDNKPGTGDNPGGNNPGEDNPGEDNPGPDNPGEEDKKDSNSFLKSLTISSGTLDFKEDKFTYYVSLPNSVTTVSLNVKLSSDKANMRFTFNGKTVNSLENLTLNEGENIVTIKVVAEDGTFSTYEVIINRAKYVPSADNVLSSITVGGKLIPGFTGNDTDYYVYVASGVKEITVKATARDSKAKITYKYKDVDYNDLNEIKLELKHGDNIIEIIVKSESGEKVVYTVTIYRATRIIKFESNYYRINVNSEYYDIIYTLYEKDRNGKEIPVENINLKEVEAFFSEGFTGDFVVDEGYIKVIPNVSLAGESYYLTVESNDGSAATKVEFYMEDYYLKPQANYYNIDIIDNGFGKKSIIIDNNFFDTNSKVSFKETETGIRVFDENNKHIYIDIDYDKEINKDNIEFVKVLDDSHLVIKVKTYNEGTFELDINGYVKDNNVANAKITLRVNNVHILILDANGGFFDEFTTKYKFKVNDGEDFYLTTTKTLSDGSSYEISYKTGYLKKDECNYYPFNYFSTDKDDLDETQRIKPNVNIITINKSMILYSIYDVDTITNPIIDKTLYLTEVDLFHNEEYYKAYGVDKIIYPGASGSYVLRINNNTGKKITLRSLNLEEIDPICVDDGCLNMGYVVKDYNDSFYYGESDEQYIILNQDDDKTSEGVRQVILDSGIVLNNRESTEISLLWKWVGDNNKLDTQIGNIAAASETDTPYSLRVSISFTTEEVSCQ